LQSQCLFTSSDEETPLHIAAKSGSAQFAAALISFGAEVGSQDRTGATPLHYAIANLHFPVAKVLLANGADDNARNNEGQAPADVGPLAQALETKAFFNNWEEWDDMMESVEFHGKLVQ
jgi:ankyrin repeat protein